MSPLVFVYPAVSLFFETGATAQRACVYCVWCMLCAKTRVHDDLLDFGCLDWGVDMALSIWTLVGNTRQKEGN